MGLANFKGKEAIEVLADVMTPISTIVSDNEFRGLIRTKGKSVASVTSYVLNTFPNEILDIYESLTKESREEATPVKLVQMVMDIVNDEELRSLFFLSGQTETSVPFGSATESTGDGGN